MNTRESRSVCASFCCENVGGHVENAVRMHERNNVTVVIKPISKNELYIYTDTQETEQGVAVGECIPAYHKLAFNKTHKEEPVVKYGEWIRIATCDIRQGIYIYIHNVWNTKR